MDAQTLATSSQPIAAHGYVRAAPAPFMPPPLATVGALGWIRANLFPSVGSGVLTVLIFLSLIWIALPLIDFLIVDAVWTGSDREACLATAERPVVGACWAYIADRFAYVVYGSYPIAGRWRVDIFFAMLAFGTAWLLWLEAPRPRYRLDLFFRFPAACILPAAAWLRSDRAPGRRYRGVGRLHGDHRGFGGRHRS